MDSCRHRRDPRLPERYHATARRGTHAEGGAKSNSVSVSRSEARTGLELARPATDGQCEERDARHAVRLAGHDGKEARRSPMKR